MLSLEYFSIQFDYFFFISLANDELCSLSQDIGPCKAAIKRYAFNSRSLKCEEFIYGGCLGNKNNFETVDDCNKQCSSIAPTQSIFKYFNKKIVLIGFIYFFDLKTKQIYAH